MLLMMPGVAHAAPPANDDFADAIAVTEPLPFSDSQDTTEATLEPDEPALGDVCGHKVRHTVWYSFVPSADTFVAANTFGSDFDTVLGVWEGTALTDLSLVGCNDDTQDLQSAVSFHALQSVEYRIQIGGYSGSSGDLELTVREITAGVIEGTVTDEGDASPIEGVCVFAQDVAGFGGQGFALTDGDGDYEVVVRPGEYTVQFYDCARDAHIPEWWDDVARAKDASEVDVATDETVSGIDAALTPACPGWGGRSGNQVLGTSGDDELMGSAQRDVMCGFGGNDHLTGFDARDVLIGGAGEDELRGGANADLVFGGRNADSLFGGPGGDRLTGGRGRDRCDGGTGDDRLRSCEISVG